MDPFIIHLNSFNLCTWYLMPLAGLNINSFGADNFINCFVVKGRQQIAVAVHDTVMCMPMFFHPQYESVCKDFEFPVMVFNFPDLWKEEFDLFLQGKYSEMSDGAKDTIRAYSGLRYQVPDQGGVPLTDAVLMALERHESLKEKWLELLGEDTDLSGELLSAPKPQWFLEIKGSST